MSTQQNRDDGGQFARERDPVEVIDAMEPLEPYATSELADRLDWPRRTAYEVLDELAAEGVIYKKKPERSRAIWMRVVDGESP